MIAKFPRGLFLFLVSSIPIAASDLPKNIKLEVQMQETLTSDSV